MATNIETAVVSRERVIISKKKKRAETLIDENGIRYALFKGEKFLVPTVEQADELGIDYLSYDRWYEAEAGDWIETADGYVLKVRLRNNNPKFSYIKTIFGTYTVGKEKNIRYHIRRGEPNTAIGTRPNVIGNTQFGKGVGGASWAGGYSPQQRKFIYLVAHQIAQNGEPDWWAAAKAAFPKRKFIHKLDLSRLINSPKIQDAILKTISEILKEQGAGADWAIRGIMQLADSEQTPAALRFQIYQEILFLDGYMPSQVAIQIPQMYARLQLNKGKNGKVDLFVDKSLEEVNGSSN